MKRRTVAFASEARRDLLELGDWIAERTGIETALSYVAGSKPAVWASRSAANAVIAAMTSDPVCGSPASDGEC
ncbi:MAG: hypothetical protein J0J01_10265 [Reyranella sp.]|uniref:hypothetical protein n=1 Tax=Reyranella sp. TaxID=1929291 RepID=UPI001ACC94DA|nr:hypothetical protein [Reyranella sp.]MBN9087278.1 hypothetical protein [Reyranella sp.]